MRSPRLTLRQWVEADATRQGVAVATSLEHLRPWMPWIESEPLTRSQRVGLIRTWRADWEQGGDVVIGAFIGDVVIGSAGLHRRRGPRLSSRSAIGYTSTTRGRDMPPRFPPHSRRPRSTVPEIDHVEIHHDKANTASAGIPRRLGYTLIDETPNAVSAPAEVGIDCRWSMNRQDWIDRPCLSSGGPSGQ